MQVLVHLRCRRCHGVFFAPRLLFFKRLEAGLPLMGCKNCDREAWRTDLADTPRDSGSTSP